jgi:hypothetical protein
MSKPKGAKHARSRGMWQVPPYASKLTQAHRAAARADHAFAQALREQTMYPQRIDALIAGQTWYSGKACAKCGSSKRRVRDCGCWSCQKARTGFELDERGRCVSLGTAKRSRDGWLALADEKRRERAGEFIEHVAGEWLAREHPGGRLAVRCAAASIDSQDFRNVPGQRVFDLCHRYADLLALLRMVGWSI